MASSRAILSGGSGLLVRPVVARMSGSGSHIPRSMSTVQSQQNEMKDWDAKQYLKFEDQRTIPVRDLLAKVPLQKPARVIDLGCGPGNSTEVLAARYPDAHITGMDSSPDMLQKARRLLPHLEFAQADLSTYIPDRLSDLYFSNAVFHWLPPDQRIPIMRRLLHNSASGTVLALQIPDNTLEPSHASMREAARSVGTTAGLENSNSLNHAFPAAEELYDSLQPLCAHIDTWRTTYSHVLEDHQAIIEWVKGTGLRPFVDPLSPDQQKLYLDQYLRLLKMAYKPLNDGKVLLRYPRLFLVAVRS